jgi:uncharacterized protein YndB with AHSA1/START domain
MATHPTITVEAIVNAPVEKVWKAWTTPGDITRWNSPSPDWHSPKAEHELKAGGQFNYRMEAKDGSAGFDFCGVFDVITPNRYIEYTIADGRKVKVNFIPDGPQTKVSETFEAEDQNAMEMQKAGWQAILDCFKNYAETNN